MKFTFTNGFQNGDFSKVVSTAVDYELKAEPMHAYACFSSAKIRRVGAGTK